MCPSTEGAKLFIYWGIHCLVVIKVFSEMCKPCDGRQYFLVVVKIQKKEHSHSVLMVKYSEN